MDNRSSVRRVSCPLESVSTTFQSLDTVRALHQTVVSLRAALEDAKSEIQRLRSQIRTQSEVKDRDKLEPLATEREAPVLPEDGVKEQKGILEVFAKPKEEIPEIELEPSKDLVKSSELEEEPPTPSSFYQPSTTRELRKLEKKPKISIVPDISVVAYPSKDESSKMASKIDVKIKVMSNIKVDGSSSDASSSGEPSSDKRDQEDKERGSDSTTVSTAATENVKIKTATHGSYTVTHSSREGVNVEEKDDSLSEGDNSVFVEEKPGHREEGKSSEHKGVEKDQEVKEEVDDIELIFSSEENRDPIQEDLVSISEYDPWQATGGSGTPVLVKFASLPSDQDSGQKPKETKIPMSTTCDAFYEANTISFSHERSLESSDSFDNQTTNKSSSLEKDNSEDRRDEGTSLGRDESLDFFDNRDMGAVGRKWTNYNVLVETDISKCGILEETTFEIHRRNTCPNPPAYRPIMTRHIPPRLVSRYCRRGQYGPPNCSVLTGPTSDEKYGPKRSSSAQTDISALPDYWKSESQLTGHRYQTGGQCTLPSKFVPTTKLGCPKHTLRISGRTQEARRVLLSDINFTSMVPELSRSADHLCQDERRQEQINKQVSRYYKGNLLKTPDYALKGITPSASMTSPGVSQWTVNENSFGTQTIQTGESWGKRGDSFDSCRSYSTDSRCSGLDPHHRSRSVPSIRCAICKQNHSGHGIRTSESMHYTPRVTFQEPACRVRGSLPDLRHDCVCSRRYGNRSMFPDQRDSSGSTESLLDEAEAFVRKSMDSSLLTEDTTAKRPNLRRMSENDIQRDYIPSKQSLPFLPKTANCLKPGHLAKVISKNGRVVVGRVKYVGPLISNDKSEVKSSEDLFVGVQLQSKCGDCDGTYEGRKIFDCEPLQGLFVPFKKVVMAWTG